MQIHELNSYTGALDAGAYLAVDNGSDTGKVAVKSITDPVNERIDQIIAGDAPSAAEIIDARLGGDGVTYDSLGDAIRGQYVDLKDDIANSNQGLEDFGMYADFVRGTLSSGVVQTYMKYRVTTDTILSFTKNLYLTIAAGFRISVQYFVGGSFSSDTGWLTGEYVIQSGTSFKILIARETDQPSEVADISYFVKQVTFNSALGDVKDDVDSLLASSYGPAALPLPEDAWIRWSNGEKVASAATNLYVFTNDLPTSIKAFLASDTNVLAAIAFYSTEGIDTNGYLQSDSVDFLNGTHNDGVWYKAIVPDNCKTIAIVTKKPGGSVADSEILFPEVYNIKRMIQTPRSPFEKKPCFGHLFVNQTSAPFTSNILIPCQSIFDVQVTARLGFDYIEANVHKTSDGKYVVTHGLNGNLGNDFEKLDGTQPSNVSIAGNTLADLQANYRYRSSYDKYKVPITTLEEFLLECKRWGLSVVLQYVDDTELRIAREIIGDNMVVYNGTRNSWSGYIMEYLSLGTKEDIVRHCQQIGAPYMYNMSNPTSFTESQLREIIAAVHDVGCLIGFTGVYQSRNDIHKYIDYGFDFNASGLQVNDFESGNMWDYTGDLDFSEITHNGTVTNGVLHLANGEYIRIAGNAANFLTKVSMHITFNGKLYVDGAGSGIYMESDGNNSMWESRFYNNVTPVYKWESSGDTYIYNITVKASKC